MLEEVPDTSTIMAAGSFATSVHCYQLTWRNITEDTNPKIVRAFDNKMLWRMFDSKGEVVGEWRKMHNEELHNQFPSPYMTK
jgi:hypothetical protein